MPFPGAKPPAPQGEQIILNPPMIPAPPKVLQPKKTLPMQGKPPETKDGVREVIETVVFVVVLVLMLKTFLAEAFVIPTGSMATTLLGYHKKVTCTQCDYHFLVNCSQEVDPQPPGNPRPVRGCFCPNCRHYEDLSHTRE